MDGGEPFSSHACLPTLQCWRRHLKNVCLCLCVCECVCVCVCVCEIVCLLCVSLRIVLLVNLLFSAILLHPISNKVAPSVQEVNKILNINNSFKPVICFLQMFVVLRWLSSVYNLL